MAIQWEKRLKGWSRAKKYALINEEWDRLKFLAECKNESTSKRLIGDSDFVPKRIRLKGQLSTSTGARSDRRR
jgi:hypothetical protein